ncbi:uncharacterized protein DUF3889 [Paenibacillus cellulosilyticus]|uniref:Uncharacterized protein DUF3889 n=1 Tax=Paenibacillus cellulosilyticus TaxID=375489 RepID=A0A2V2YYZ4_9BACL|nr:DUF3889 domain-containing protein [Paenibacillus cellulosilyticus]PWW06491.1 uncharacterized protein DUF3889 [Paenibacillus cellulosilyticus]QKS46169.1 DUF3889 domain-containing protein [Paenibacillus cellulosilyticus]
MPMTKWKTWFLAAVMLFTLPHPAISSAAAMSARLQPTYAEWGRLAVDYAIKEYKAEVIDYAYEGRYPASNNHVEYRFRLWVRKNAKEYAIRIAVQVNPSSGERMGLKLTELQ